MLACNNLRVDPGDGSPVADYRVVHGHVEMRILDFDLYYERKGKDGWQRLTREQVMSHVMGNTAVVRWLQRRMGVHPLIRACAHPSHLEQVEEESSPESRAA
jgi:hypothetical protein